MELSKRKCIPCEDKNLKPFDLERAEEYMVDVKGWELLKVEEVLKISREFKFKDFVEALEFVNKVGDLAETEGHHPDILMHSWNKVVVTLYTHAIGGLSENDYILAAKINTIL
ncbi:MAG: 4a-hydroxytetrahydrobiopterin dehydratase [Candidatus Paceibacterota bacterium]